jgi:hypothetical protein
MSKVREGEHLGGVRSFTDPPGRELPLADLLGMCGPQKRRRLAAAAAQMAIEHDTKEKSGGRDTVRPHPLAHRKFDSTKGYPGEGPSLVGERSWLLQKKWVRAYPASCQQQQPHQSLTMA